MLTGQERAEWIAFFKIEAERMNPDKPDSGATVEAQNDVAFRQWKQRAGAA